MAVVRQRGLITRYPPGAGFTALAAALQIAATGCSLTTAGGELCSTNSECRASFGLGWVCGSQGFCRGAAVEPRCDVVDPEPADLLTAPENHRDTIVLGSLQDRAVASKRGREKAARLAVKQANDEGGLDGATLAMVFCTVEQDPIFDDLDRGEAAKVAANYLVDVIGVPAIIGPSASSTTQTVFLEVRDRGVLVMSPSASSTVLTTLEGSSPGLLWRTTPPDSLQGAAIAEDMDARGITNVQVVHETGAYGDGLEQAFSAHFLTIGTATSNPFSVGNTIQRTNAVDAAGADTTPSTEVLFAAQTIDMVAMINQAAPKTEYAAKSLFVTDTAANDDFIKVAINTVFGRLRGTRPAPLNVNDPVYGPFLGVYEAEYNESAQGFSYTAHSYDAAWLVLYGVAWSQLQQGSVTGIGIATGLQHVTAGPSGMEIDIRATSWQSVVEQFRAGNSIDVTGASGDLDYDPVTEETSGPVEVWIVGGADPNYVLQCDRIWTRTGGLNSCP